MKIIIIKSILLVLAIIASPAFALATDSENPAHQVLQRSIGEANASKFVFHQIESEKDNDWYQISVKNNAVHVSGSSPVALSKGAYAFIKDNNYGVVTWEGSNVNIPNTLQDKEGSKVSSSMNLRMYINPVTYGYTMAWWTWDRWQKELDWMALHGINLPIALLGQEAIWQDVWKDIGIAENKLGDYHTGPGFLPWFRMGNIYGHHGPLPQSWIDNDKALQKHILNRMRQLGMRPVVPAFSGHVPPYFQTLYPQSKTYRLENWGGLEASKASILLDPKDPMFTKIGKLFLEKYEAEYGKSDLFLADSFNEMLPPVSEDNTNLELAEYGEAIYKSIREHNPKATWVLQGWTFGHQGEFWNSETTQSFFSRIPKDNLLMLNYGEDRYPIWERLEAFYGFKWTFGYVHNYGGQQSLFGDMAFYREQYRDLINNSEKGNLVGYGSLPEAIENNSIIYEYIFDVPWGGTDKSVQTWVNDHISNRYGSANDKVKEAWAIALENTYTLKEWRGVTDGWLINWLNDNVFNQHPKTTKAIIAVDAFFSKVISWFNKPSDDNKPLAEEGKEQKRTGLGYGTYVHNNRPTFSGIDTSDYIGNPESIKNVLALLISQYPNYQDSELYYYDIVDFAQHYVAYKADDYLFKASEFYKADDFLKGDQQFAKTKQLLTKLELLQVVTGGSFTQWCEDAIQHATNEEQRLQYLRNAKAQVTVWGGDRLKDYASKSWSGLLSDFYIPRWELFVEKFKAAKEGFNQAAVQEDVRLWEEQWVLKADVPQSPDELGKGDTIALINAILADY